MAKLFKLTYFNGVSEFVKMELESIEHVANQVFGKAVDELKSFGGNVEEVTEDKIGAVEKVATDVEQVKTDVENTKADVNQTLTDANAVSTGSSTQAAAVTTPPLGTVEGSAPATTQNAVVTPPPAPPAPPPVAPWAPPAPPAPPAA